MVVIAPISLGGGIQGAMHGLRDADTERYVRNTVMPGPDFNPGYGHEIYHVLANFAYGTTLPVRAPFEFISYMMYRNAWEKEVTEYCENNPDWKERIDQHFDGDCDDL